MPLMGTSRIRPGSSATRGPRRRRSRTRPTAVVAPLMGLEDDQLAHLRSAGLAAAVLNSKQSVRARAAALEASRDPDEFVFVSPEQLTNVETREWLRRAQPGLFVVDEA